MLRKVVLVGDPPSTGGAVLPNGCNATVNGVSKALIGGAVWCAACKSEGVIVKSGGPHRSILYGSEEALEGDLVICKCRVPPKLHALAVSSRPPLVMVDDRMETLGALPPPFRQYINMRQTRRPVHGLAHSLQFELKNQATGELLVNTPYRILSSHNTEYQGLSDSSGLTEIIENDNPFTAQVEAPYYGNLDEHTSIHASEQCGADSCAC